MADFREIGKQVPLILGIASVLLWIRILRLRQEKGSVFRATPREPVSWTESAALSTFVAAFFAPVLLSLIFNQIWPNHDQTSTSRTVALVCLSTLAQMLISVLLLFLQSGTTLRAADFGLQPMGGLASLRAGFLGFLASLLPVYAVNLIVYSLGWHSLKTQHPLIEILHGAHSVFAKTGVVLAAIVLAPLAEELLYRVVLQGGLERRLTPKGALWTTAILFAGVHSLTGRPDALPLLPLALILGYLYQQTRSYLAVFTLHALFNSLTVVIALFGKSM